MSIDTARNCFNQNLNCIDPKIQPEKFNLYQGLYSMADEIDKVTQHLDRLDSTLNNILSVLTNR